eukprot:1442998-Prorocentrum_lima.AAC.1
MTSSLVGSEMCIRDSNPPVLAATPASPGGGIARASGAGSRGTVGPSSQVCLLYTSDAADDM